MPDRAAIVTGASRGIGRAIAELLGEEGYALTISARKPEGIEKAAQELRANGYEVEGLAANMASDQGVLSVVERHRERYDDAATLARQALADDPYREGAWRLVMRVASALGDDDGVVRAYRACEQALAEVGATPAPTTRRLLDQLRR